MKPERVYPPSGGVEYEGMTVFSLTTDPELATDDLSDLLFSVLDGDRYTFSDRPVFPAPVFLVHDHVLKTVYRAVLRTNRIELHVLPNTESAGLQAIYDDLCDSGSVTWQVECRTTQN